MSDVKSLYTSFENQHKLSEDGLLLVPDNVIRQELVTFVITDNGLKRVTRTRDFRQSTHDEQYGEEVLRSSR